MGSPNVYLFVLLFSYNLLKLNEFHRLLTYSIQQISRRKLVLYILLFSPEKKCG